MRKLVVTAILLSVASALSAQTTVYSTTDFSGWFVGTTGKAFVSNGDLLTTASTTNAALAYFKAPGSQYSVTVGETLTLSVNFTMASGTSINNSQNLYITLQNSGSTGLTNNQISANLAGTSNAAFANYTGYALMINPAPSAASAGRFNNRSGTNSNIVASTGAWTQIQALGSTTIAAFTTNKNYNITFSLKEVSSSAFDFTYTLTNTTDSTQLYTTSYSATGLSGSSFVGAFDTIALGTVATQTGSYKFTDLSLTSSLGAVPEPSTYALGAGLAAVGFAALRRFRRGRTA